MTPDQQLTVDDQPVRTIDTPEGEEAVVDLGVGTTGSAEVVGDTVIVVTGDDEYDIDLEVPAERAYINNGILTIRYGDSA